MAAAASAQILGAAVVIIGDRIATTLAHAKKMGFETVDISKHDKLGEQIAEILGGPGVDAGEEAVGFEARGHGSQGEAASAAVLNELMEIRFVAGGLGIPGLY